MVEGWMILPAPTSMGSVSLQDWVNKLSATCFLAVVGTSGSGKSSLVMGMGNIGGPGLDLVQYFRNRSMLKEAS